jgi:hypothetical protein
MARDGIQAAGTVDAPCGLNRPAARAVLAIRQVELLTPRTVMESVHLTRVGPAKYCSTATASA